MYFCEVRFIFVSLTLGVYQLGVSTVGVGQSRVHKTYCFPGSQLISVNCTIFLKILWLSFFSIAFPVKTCSSMGISCESPSD